MFHVKRKSLYNYRIFSSVRTALLFILDKAKKKERNGLESRRSFCILVSLNIKYMSNLQERFESKIYYSIDGCWYWTDCTNNKGYGRIIVKGKSKVASRVSYELYVKSPGDLFVLHHCDNPLCVNPNHLFLGTNLDNMRDMIKKNRKVILKGTDHPRAVLTKEDVLKIRHLSKTTCPYRISKIMNLDRTVVRGVVNNKTYKNITYVL